MTTLLETAPERATSDSTAELWGRIQAFRFDPLTVDSPFAARLARENAWTLGHTGRAMCEYRRFLFLALVAGHPVSPSDAVDQVWHLHLLDTRSYWGRLCPQVLGRTLHHVPSRGGAEERVRLLVDYDRTLASYRRLFGEEAPADLWPPSEVRFRADLHRFQRIDIRRYWLLDRAIARSVGVAAAAAAALASTLCILIQRGI